MIKTLWFSFYVLLFLLSLACFAGVFGSIAAALTVSPLFWIALPVAIVLAVLFFRAALWAVSRGVDS